jgi:hypothetical protein
MERQRDRETERQRDREIERDRETKNQRESQVNVISLGLAQSDTSMQSLL